MKTSISFGKINILVVRTVCWPPGGSLAYQRTKEICIYITHICDRRKTSPKNRIINTIFYICTKRLKQKQLRWRCRNVVVVGFCRFCFFTDASNLFVPSRHSSSGYSSRRFDRWFCSTWRNTDAKRLVFRLQYVVGLGYFTSKVPMKKEQINEKS